MLIDTVFAGNLRREFLLPLVGRPLLDVPGGNVLYAAAGSAVWRQPGDDGIGLMARIGEDYPRHWLETISRRGFDVEGIHILPERLDLRSFRAYADGNVPQENNPVAHFIRLGIPYPKSLLGYQSRSTKTEPQTPSADAPHPDDIPGSYAHIRAVHLCPLDYLSHNRLLTHFHQLGVRIITMDPAASWMVPAWMGQVRILVHGLTAFLPSEDEVRSLFWGQLDDLWEMAEALASFGCDHVVVKCGGRGQILYDAISRKRWEIPAYPVNIADPTSAGDSFCGGFLSEFSRTGDPLRAVLSGSVSASLALEGSGAFHAMDTLPGLPRARLESLVGIIRQI